MNKTLKYYNENSQTLSVKYNSVDLSALHKDLLDFFRESKALLEIGSGSGRDMSFMIKNGFDVYGIDGSQEMVKNAVSNYSNLNNRLFLSELPKNLPSFDKKFDGLFSIATLMHFKADELKLIFQKLNGLLKSNSKVFISVSGHRETKDDNRFFLELSKSEWISIFKENNFNVIRIKENKDFSGRNIDWYTFFLKTRN